MAGSLNKVMLIGRLGKDPEMRYTAGGSPVTNFTMATDESYTDQSGNRVDKAEWHRIVVFGRQAEIAANYLAKGRLVFVEGRLQTSSWEDQQGNKRYTTEIIAQRFQFLESKGQGGQQYDNYGDQQGPGDYNQGGPGQGGPGQQQRPQGGQGGRTQQNRQQSQQPPQQQEDMGPAFPSEASGMDDVPF